MNNSYGSHTDQDAPVKTRLYLLRKAAIVIIAACGLAAVAIGGLFAASARQSEDTFRSGERLTYTISFNKNDSAAFAEIKVVSRGKLQGKDVVELYGKLRSVDLLSAAFFLWDDTRTTYVSPETGYPVYVRAVSNAGLLPVETVKNYLKQPSTELDLLSLVYKARQTRGVGSFLVNESDRSYVFDFVSTVTETVKTEAGEYETNVSNVSSEYLTQLGITDFKINFSTDDKVLPVMVRFRTSNVAIEARLASIQDLSPKVEESPNAETPRPTPVLAPTPEPTPKPYIDNLPLSTDLPFVLGETLRYAVTKKGIPVAEVSLSAKERKLISGTDSLLLTAYVNSLGSANDLLGANDVIASWVDPDTLAPFSYSLQFSAALSAYSQSATFNQADGTVSLPGGQIVQVPVGTHNIISLAYAVRAFNLRSNPDPTSPVNDTRVAVLLGIEPVVLTLRPSSIETLEIGGAKRPVQMISVKAGVPAIDRLNIRFWLSSDGRRIPLKLAAGEYEAELLSIKTEGPPSALAGTITSNSKIK